MIKPASLRAAIVAAIPSLAADPDKLTVFIDTGSIAATGAKSLSFEYRYTCNVILLDFAGDSDDLFIAIVGWVRQYQNDLVDNPDERANGITYEVDILGTINTVGALKAAVAALGYDAIEVREWFQLKPQGELQRRRTWKHTTSSRYRHA